MDNHSTYFEQARELVAQRGQFWIVTHYKRDSQRKSHQEYLSPPFQNESEADAALNEIKPEYPDAKVWRFQTRGTS